MGCDASEPDRLYSDAEVDYFLEVALGSEYSTNQQIVRKWNHDIIIEVSGTPTPEDLQTLSEVVADLNALIDPIEIRVQGDNQPGAHTEIIFEPTSEFSSTKPSYVPGNQGFFYVRWTGCTMTSSRILISSDEVTQRQRSHLIREELTQTLGLMRDSYTYPSSIFYQDWTEVTSFAPIDETLIEMLYRPEVMPCMNAERARAALSEIAP